MEAIEGSKESEGGRKQWRKEGRKEGNLIKYYAMVCDVIQYHMIQYSMTWWNMLTYDVIQHNIIRWGMKSKDEGNMVEEQ